MYSRPPLLLAAAKIGDMMINRPWLANYDPGVPESIPYPNVPLYHFLDIAAQKYPDRPCTIFKGAKISYAEMQQTTIWLAAGLKNLGIQKGDRVGLILPNTPQFVIAYFAALRIGAVVVAINPFFKAAEIETLINRTGIETLILLSDAYPLLKDIQSRTAIKRLIVSHLKEAFTPLGSFLFTLL